MAAAGASLRRAVNGEPMTAVGEWRATYAPGDWLVLCGPTSVVVLEPPGEGWTALVAELWEQVVTASSLQDLAARLAGYGLDTMPSFGALFWTGSGMRSLVRGGVRVVDPATGQVVADGDGVQTWSETALAAVTTVRIETGQPDQDADGPDAAHDSGTLLLPLVVGAVRASSVLLDARAEAQLDSPQPRATDRDPQQASGSRPGTEDAGTSRTVRDEQEDEHEAEQEDGDPLLPPTEAMAGGLPPGSAAGGGTLPLTEGDEAPTEPELAPVVPAVTGPMVLGVVCPYGHANPPGATRCSDCGVRVTETEPHPVPQPALATLRVSDGTELALDRLVRVGRAPVGPGDRDVRLLTVPSPSQDISRTHLEIVPDGWQIMVRDLNSTNGTVLAGPDGGERRPLPPGESVPVDLGSVLELADGVSVLLDLPQ